MAHSIESLGCEISFAEIMDILEILKAKFNTS